MRGIQFAVLTLFWMIAIAIIIASMQLIPALSHAKTQNVLIKTDVYMMSSAMDAAESYLGAALQYSNYQACYVLLKKGGNAQLAESNKISYNGIDYGIVPDRQEFMDSLKNQIQGNLNAYSIMGYNLSKKYAVGLPPYTLSVAEGADGLSASASSAGKMVSEMEVKGGNLDAEKSNINGKVTIIRSADISAKLRLNCASLYDDMKALSDSVQEAAGDSLDLEIQALSSGVEKDSADGCMALKDEAAKRISDTVTAAMTQASGGTKLSYAEEQHQLPAKSGKISWFASDAGDSCKSTRTANPDCSAKQIVCEGGLGYGADECCQAGTYAHYGAWQECLGKPYDTNWYAAMRWPVSEKSWWQDRKILVTNPSNGKKVVLEMKDRGPSESTGRVIDVSKEALAELGASTDTVVQIEFADPSSRPGPVDVGGGSVPSEQPSEPKAGKESSAVLEVKLNMELITPVEKGQNGKYLCRFRSSGTSSVVAKVAFESSQSAPVWNGEKISYEPLDGLFAVKSEV